MLPLFWIWHYGSLMYLYHYTEVQFVFIYPNWALILFILMGLLVIVIGILVLLAKKKIRTGYFQLFGILIIGILIDLIIVT